MADMVIKRDYIIADAELTAFGQIVCSNITRDIAEFAPYNVTAAEVTSLQALCDAFENFPSDDFYNMEYQAATETKDNLIAEMKVLIRSMALRVDMKWGKNSAYYRNLGIADMSQLSDDSFLARCRKIHGMMTSFLADLASGGLTQDMLDDMADKIQELDDAKHAQDMKLIERTIKTTERIEKGNELYAIISRYCEIGKTIWYGVNSAKYNSYVIYNSQNPGPLEAPQNLIFNYSSKVLWWDMVENATSYQLEWFDGSDYVEIYSGSEDHFAYIPAEGLNKFRVRAHNAGGYGDYSQVLEQYYFTTLPKAQNLQIVQSGVVPTEGELTWDAVPTVVNYKVYQSVDNLGEYAAHWLVIGTVTEPMKSVTLTLGKRNSFRIESNNTFQTSMSDPVYIEV